MIIDIPIVKEKDNNILVTSSVDKNLLWFELNKNYKNWITSSSDPFLIGLIFLLIDWHRQHPNDARLAHLSYKSST
jgi:hypothetical protein